MAKKTTKKKATKKKAAKKRQAKKPKPVVDQVELDIKIVAEAVRMIVIECKSDDEIRALSRIDEVDLYLIEAHARLSAAAHIDREAEIGASIARLKAIGSGAMGVGDFGPAIQAQKELSKLLALYPEGGSSSSTGPSTADQLSQIEQIEAHLRPLGLVPDTYPIEGVARVAADRIRQLEAQRS